MSQAFKNNLKSLREARKLTQWDLAHELKTNQGLISLMESGHVRPSPKIQKLYAKVLKCTVEDIWEDGIDE